jgi:REP element-mobilizing transposase RayT
LSKYIHKSHNVSVLIYHFVCPAKYRKIIFSKEVDETLKGICLEISKRYEISFLEIGTDRDHVHFLIQSIPKYSVTEIIRMIKSITAKKIFEKHPEVKKQLWGGEFWSDGFFVNTVSKYVRKQGMEKEYKKLHCQQISLF